MSYAKPDTRDTIVRRIGAVRRILAAAPAFLESSPVHRVEDLAAARVVATAAVLSRRGALILCRGAETVEVELKPCLCTNNAEVLVRSLLSGRYVGPVQALLVTRELADGLLVRVLPECEVKTHDVFLSYPSARHMRPAVRAFIDHLVPHLQSVDGID